MKVLEQLRNVDSFLDIKSLMVKVKDITDMQLQKETEIYFSKKERFPYTTLEDAF